MLGKKVLLIALPGYSNGMIKQMQELGAEVDFINDKPNEGFICKTFGRLQLKAYQRVINKYYFDKIQKLSGKTYDYILVIRGEYTTIGALELLIKRFPKAKRILYMWDGLHKRNTFGIEKKWKYYNKVFTFDRIDYLENKDKIQFLPLYYYDEYIPKWDYKKDKDNFRYDVSFIGTGHADRVKIVKSVMEQCKLQGLKTFCYIYMPHPLIFLFNKLTNKDFKNVRKQDIHFTMIPFEKLYKIYGKSRCILDVENPGQHGLTMRSIETLGLKKKFITTNQDIVNYDFYNSNNVLVIERNNPQIDIKFFTIPYEALDDKKYEKYSLSNWIRELLRESSV